MNRPGDAGGVRGQASNPYIPPNLTTYQSFAEILVAESLRNSVARFMSPVRPAPGAARTRRKVQAAAASASGHLMVRAEAVPAERVGAGASPAVGKNRAAARRRCRWEPGGTSRWGRSPSSEPDAVAVPQARGRFGTSSAIPVGANRRGTPSGPCSLSTTSPSTSPAAPAAGLNAMTISIPATRAPPPSDARQQRSAARLPLSYVIGIPTPAASLQSANPA
jgi:hypothetical protein